MVKKLDALVVWGVEHKVEEMSGFTGTNRVLLQQTRCSVHVPYASDSQCRVEGLLTTRNLEPPNQLSRKRVSRKLDESVQTFL